MNIPDTTNCEGAHVFQTNIAVYASCFANGMVAVRVLGDVSGVAGSWIDRPPVSSDWRTTAQLMICEWESTIRKVERYKHTNRNVCWATALKRGAMVLDYCLGELWYCVVFAPKEIC